MEKKRVFYFIVCLAFSWLFFIGIPKKVTNGYYGAGLIGDWSVENDQAIFNPFRGVYFIADWGYSNPDLNPPYTERPDNPIVEPPPKEDEGELKLIKCPDCDGKGVTSSGNICLVCDGKKKINKIIKK
jgi:hypothetical protein